MSWLDIVIIVVVVFFCLAGLKNGIIRTVFSLVGLVVGIILASNFAPQVAKLLVFIKQETLANIVAFVLILLVVTVTATVVAQILSWTASLILLGWLNRLGGGALGLAVGSLICGALLAIWVKCFGATGAIAESLLAAVLLDKFPIVLGLLPADFDAIRSFFR